MQSVKQVLTWDRATKNTHRYQVEEAIADTAAIPTIYIRKNALPDNPPKRITVTVWDYDDKTLTAAGG